MLIIIIIIITVVPTPSLITLTSSKDNSIQIIGSDVALTCAVILNSAILNSEISTFIRMLMVDVHLSKDGKPLTPTDSLVTGTTFIYTTQLNSFQRSDFGSYTCTATIRPQPTSVMPVNLTGVDVLSDTLTIKAGKCLQLAFMFCSSRIYTNIMVIYFGTISYSSS